MEENIKNIKKQREKVRKGKQTFHESKKEEEGVTNVRDRNQHKTKHQRKLDTEPQEYVICIEVYGSVNVLPLLEWLELCINQTLQDYIMERLIYFIKHPLPSLPSSQVSPVDEHRFKRKDLEAGNQNDEKKLEESGSNNKSITSTSSFVKK